MSDKKKLIAEHEKLIPILREGSNKEREAEAADQAKELKEMKKEELIFKANGQWRFSKAIPEIEDVYGADPNNPKHMFTGRDRVATVNQIKAGIKRSLGRSDNAIKDMPNIETGKIEPHYLLHRGFDVKGKLARQNPNDVSDNDDGTVSTHGVSVHTTQPSVAHDYGGTDYDPESRQMKPGWLGEQGQIRSFWVPESKLHGDRAHFVRRRYPDEEDTVEPHAYEQTHTSILPGKYRTATKDEYHAAHMDEKKVTDRRNAKNEKMPNIESAKQQLEAKNAFKDSQHHAYSDPELMAGLRKPTSDLDHDALHYHKRGIDAQVSSYRKLNQDHDNPTTMAEIKPFHDAYKRLGKSLDFNSNGQWSLTKMSNYGPKGAGLYDPVVNQKRKANNTGDEVVDAGRNKNVKEYTSAKQGTAKDQAEAVSRKQAKLNAKQPVKTTIDPELKAKLEAEANRPKS